MCSMCNPVVKFAKLYPDAQIPLHASHGAAGYDLYCYSLERQGSVLRCGTGVAVEIPSGYAGFIYARASLCFTGLEKVGGVCVIDSDYRGELFVVFRELLQTDFDKQMQLRANHQYRDLFKPYCIRDRIAQLVVQPCLNIETEVVPYIELSKTQRGAGAFVTGIR